MESALTQLILTPGEITDLEEIMVIERASFSFPWTKGMVLSELFENPFSFSTVVRAGDTRKIIAQVFMRLMVDELHLLNLGVHPAWRRRGLGTRLIRHVLSTAKAKEAERVILEVRDTNHAAQALYQKTGFRRIGLRKNYYRKPKENALLFQYDLNTLHRASDSQGQEHLEKSIELATDSCGGIKAA